MSNPESGAPERIVIVGFGPVAARLVEHLEPLVAAGKVAVTVIGQEKEAAYNRVLVADVAVGRSREAAIGLADPAALMALGVDVRLDTRVAQVDRPARQVLLDDGEVITYHRLVFATGSRPILPCLEGMDDGGSQALPAGVGFLRDLDDARAVATALASRERIVVLGGGILGIEAAIAAAEEGGRVTLVHHGRSPMERLLGEGALVLAAALRNAGIAVVAGTSTGVHLADGRFAGLDLADGTRIDGGRLVLACGVRPRTELAEECGLDVADGVLVDHTLRAVNAEGIWAIGDCAEVRCRDSSCPACTEDTAPQGLIGPGWQQADYLGMAWAAEFAGVPASVVGLPERRDAVLVLKARGVDAVTAGETDADPWAVQPGLAVAVWADPGHGRYVKIVTRDGVLTGLVCVGMPRTGAELVLLFERGSELPADRSSLLRLDSAEGVVAAIPSGPDATLCRCAGVTRGAVADSVVNGCTSVPDVSASTRAGTGCGGCHEDIKAVIEQHFAVAV
ncbi:MULTISPECIES: FAD-dependent oxidoreductase [unclassified Arthrobacter]|uniref:FAD-dependent oxidoreductase n=1 Tax=unclassified Arthrobacter TaxID=235627 RepID=UPI000319FB49|nr:MULTISPECIES: FAD-dependent oxidoreductase [unclassified Arthrobacter]PVE19555.1 NAD(P)/FAD-dependent oxidoreductase [Arthrobacter sp. Bz4]